MNVSPIKLVECPRDAMQGIHQFIPTELKARYINQLLKVGFHTIDFGSFVSPKAIPQMRDTAEVLAQLDLTGSKSKLLAIVANKRGAIDAVQFDEITYLGYPFSVSETFQLRNTNATIEESLNRVADIQDICFANKKKLVIYLSMGFGNPYGDPWNVDMRTHIVGSFPRVCRSSRSLQRPTTVASGLDLLPHLQVDSNVACRSAPFGQMLTLEPAGRRRPEP